MLGRTNTGGGGGGLNFKVVGGTAQPESPKENTIWVKSSNPVTQWIFTKDPNAWVTENGSINILFTSSSDYGMTKAGTALLFNGKMNGTYGQFWVELTDCKQSDGTGLNSVNAYIYKSGSWNQFSSSFYATINVTYPAGSTCTATDGATTLTAPDTSGSWACVVPNTGTWTISCTDSDSQTSAVVTISTAGEEKIVTLSYAVYLYNMGDTCDSITGGWTSTYNATVTNGTSSMTIMVNGSYKAGGATTVNSIDVSDYDTLIFNGSPGSGSGFSDFVIRLMEKGTVKASVTSGANVSLDISSLTGAHTVEIYCANGQSSGRAITVSKVYLTK